MKIGFVAMSGLRLCDPELLSLGLTFPGMARRKNAIEALPSLGLLTLAGMTPPSIEVQYLEIRDVDRDELPRDFDFVAISSLTATAKEAYALSARFRDIGTRVILGGLHVSLMPNEAIAHADSIVIGEGESVWPDVVADLERGVLQAVYDARMRPFDLATSPMPRFDLLEPDRYPRFTVQTQRGCPWRCEFCAASIRISPAFKVKPVSKVIAEIRRVKELWRDPFIEFADDNTFVNRAHARSLMRALVGEGIRWFSESDVSIATDDELLRMMREAGCVQVLIGFESATRSALQGIEQRSNWKAKQLDFYRRAVENIQRRGITVNGCFVVGLDGSGPDAFESVYDFVKDSGLYDVQITYMTPFPGTPLYERLRQAGRIPDAQAWERCTLFDINFQPDTMTAAELEQGFKQLGKRLYEEAFVEERHRRFFSTFRAARREQRLAA
ncbi:MAG: radical SAM protein [Chthoniobacterales bacterium]